METKSIPYYKVLAFTDRFFSGNPAGVCLLEEWLPGAQMQAIATENNLAETAFLVRRKEHFDLRWMTPAIEVELCGHATLAAAHVLFRHRDYAGNKIRFQAQSGELQVERAGERLVLDFPSRPASEIAISSELADSLGARPEQLFAEASNYMAVFPSEEKVAALRPNFEALARLDRQGVVVTAPGKDCDFVSRYFAPRAGIPEDPVTGSTHCTLIPYWSERLGKRDLFARQISSRGGQLYCQNRGERVAIGGHAVTYAEGKIFLANNG